MKKFIEQETSRIQGLLALFNKNGNWMEVYDYDGVRIFKTMVDSFTVTRIAPRFDASGEHTGSDFWLLWKSLGYNNGCQYSHTVKIVDAKVDDSLASGEWLIVDLTDDNGRRHHIEVIDPAVEKDYVEDWKSWQSYRAQNTEMFAQIDEQILADHIKVAEEWN